MLIRFRRSWHLRKSDLKKKMMVSLQLPSEKSPSSRDSSIPTLLSNYIKAYLNIRLKEVLYSEDKLYLIFEYCEFDLKKYMRHIGGALPP